MLLNMAGPEVLQAVLRGWDSGARGESLRASVICAGMPPGKMRWQVGPLECLNKWHCKVRSLNLHA